MSCQVPPEVLKQTTRQALKSLQLDGLIRPARNKNMITAATKPSFTSCCESAQLQSKVVAARGFPFKQDTMHDFKASYGFSAAAKNGSRQVVDSGSASGGSSVGSGSGSCSSSKYFEVSAKGAAIHSSGLPLALGAELYKR
jgi:hypothetical protein